MTASYRARRWLAVKAYRVTGWALEKLAMWLAAHPGDGWR